MRQTKGQKKTVAKTTRSVVYTNSLDQRFKEIKDLMLTGKDELVSSCKQTIRQAVYLNKAAIWYGKKDLSNFDFYQELTSGIQEHLWQLIHDDDINANDEMFDYFLLMKQLIIVLAQPGVLEKFPGTYGNKAALKLEKLGSFFENISTDLTDAWYDYYCLENLSSRQTEDYIRVLINHYGTEGHFLSRGLKSEQERTRNIANAYKELQEKGGVK